MSVDEKLINLLAYLDTTNMTLDAVLFDLDGLLLDTERYSERAFHATAADYGLETKPSCSCRLSEPTKITIGSNFHRS